MMTEHHKKTVPQKEAMQRLGLLPNEVKSFRAEHLTENVDWWKDGVAVIWTEEAVEAAEAILRGGSEEKQDSSALPDSTAETRMEGSHGDAVAVRVLAICKNPRFVMAGLNGNKIHIECGQKMARRIVGKTVRVLEQTIDGQTKYTLAR